MPISGTVPKFDVSATPPSVGISPTVVLVTGTAAADADARADGTQSTESLVGFYQRGLNALAMSGVEIAVGDSSDGQSVTSGALSGVLNFQREIAFRLADLQLPGAGQTQRLAHAQAALAAASGADATRNQGEIQFGA